MNRLLSSSCRARRADPIMISTLVNGILYGMHSEVAGAVKLSSVSTDKILEHMLDDAHQFDDVLTDSFRKRAVFQVPPYTNSSSYTQKISSLGLFEHVFDYDSGSIATTDTPAPFFVQGSNLHHAWRLYEDKVDVFVVPVIPASMKRPSQLVPLNLCSADGIWKLVASPSRLNEPTSDSRPLAGKRITIKQLLDREGLQTTLASRDFESLYGPSTTTTDYVTKLIELGAVIIGKTKTTQFATGDNCIDVHRPTNPQGGEYQFPEGSTTGGAVSLAACSWEAASVGTDSGGSIRRVATCNGLFSLRPSFDTTSLEGVFINSD
ncbi:amidase signature enzyme [Microthyrium microscopicum]|uniref:Amidase signature enzyme n=1 Tax=Microthyrium microscopicum TaxID=703497 RepID=A0A6A6UV97_9PEZI|nr:amidase signature enzyme [Microthyrium microscopicum]